MKSPLNVCTDATICDGWIAYVVLNKCAVIVARADFNGLDDLRYYAKREGYSGIIIGTPSVGWARMQRIPVCNECEACGKEFGSYHSDECSGRGTIVQRADCVGIGRAKRV